MNNIKEYWDGELALNVMNDEFLYNELQKLVNNSFTESRKNENQRVFIELLKEFFEFNMAQELEVLDLFNEE